MEILVITPAGDLNASVRYRIKQFIPFLESKGHRVEINALFPNRIFDLWKKGNIFTVLSIVPFLFLYRLKVLIQCFKYDVIIIHRDIVPFGPMMIEKYLKLMNKKIIVDIDDAVYSEDISEISSLKNRWAYKLRYGKRFNTSFSYASLVICGNKTLQTHVCKYNSNAVIIPTVIEDNMYPIIEGDKKRSDKIIIGWVGNPGNTKQLMEKIAVFRKISIKYPNKVEFRFVGADPSIETEYNDLPITVVPWNKKNEYNELINFDIGIMPIFDTEWSRGKCGFKIIQYMATKTSVIASPVGANNEIIDHGIDGFLADTDDDWIKYFDKLIEDYNLRTSMGNNGYTKFRENYSLSSWQGKFVSSVESINVKY